MDKLRDKLMRNRGKAMALSLGLTLVVASLLAGCTAAAMAAGARPFAVWLLIAVGSFCTTMGPVYLAFKLLTDRPDRLAPGPDEASDAPARHAGTLFASRPVEVPPPVANAPEAETRVLNLSDHPLAASGRTPAITATAVAAPPGGDRTATMALYELSRTLAGSISVEDTLTILADRLSKLVPFTTCAIALVDAARREYEVRRAVGRHAGRFPRQRQMVGTGLTGWVIQHRRPLCNTPPALDLGFLGAAPAGEYKTAMVFPLVKNGEALGAVAVYATDFEAYGGEHIQLMESACQPAAAALFNALSLQQAAQAALGSPPTGLANLRTLTALFERERARGQRLGMPLSLLAISVTNLDEAARRARTSGVQILTALSRVMRQEMRETDVLASHSVNGFIALLPDSGPAEAARVQARIREAILDAHGEWDLSLSMGTATYPQDGSRFEELLLAAQMDCVASRGAMDVVLPSLREVFTGDRR